VRRRGKLAKINRCGALYSSVSPIASHNPPPRRASARFTSKEGKEESTRSTRSNRRASVGGLDHTRDPVVTSVGAFSFVFLLFKFLLTDPRVETSLSRKRATATNEGQFTGGRGWGAPAHSLVDPLTTAVTGRHSRGTRVPIVRQRARVARK